MKEIRFSFKIPIYNARLYFTYTDNIPEAIKSLPHQLRTHDCHGCQGLYTAASPLYSITVSNLTYDTITHEIGHVARQLLEDIGFKIKASNDEPLAYLEGYLADQIHHRLKKGKAI